MDPATPVTISSLQNQLTEQRRKYHDLLAKVHEFAPHLLRRSTLPPEATCSILHFTLLSILILISRLQEKLRLRLVCREWNNIITSHPVFSMDVVLNIPIRGQWKRSIEETKARVLANDRFLFNLHMHMGFYSEDDINRYIPKQVVGFIWSNTGKIESFRYQVDCEAIDDTDDLYQMHQLFDPATSLYQDPAEEPERRPTVCTWDSLKSLHVQRGEALHNITFDAKDFPALQVVHFNGRPRRSFLDHWRLPWTQLTSVTLTEHWDPIEHYLYILQECTCLEYFRLEVDWKNGESWWDLCGDVEVYVLRNPDRTDAPRLKTLHLEFTNEPILGEFLDNLCTRSLESIHIISRPLRRETPEEEDSEVDFTDEEVIKSLRELMERSKCKLHHAHVAIVRDVALEEDSERSEGSLVGFFKSTPDLKSFQLIKANIEAFPFGHLPRHLQKLKLKLLNPSTSNIKRQFHELQKRLAEKQLGSEKPKRLTGTIETEAAIAERSW